MNAKVSYRLLPLLVCLLACMVVDLAYFPHRTVFPDEQRILASAIRLAASGEFWIGSDRAWEMPGAALFFAPPVWLFGPYNAVIPIRLAQALLLVVQCAFIAFIAGRIFSKCLVAFVASCIAALYPFLLYYQGLLLSETLFNTLLLAGLAALYLWRQRGLRVDAALVAASLCFALATLTKATLTILPPFLLAATAWIAGANIRRTITILVVAAFLYATFMSPWWVRNAMVLHAFVPFTTSSAQNFYLGNNANNPNGGIEWDKNAEPTVVAKINTLPGELARQRAYNKAALEYIKKNPVAFLHAAFNKFIRLWNLIPNAAEFRTNLYSFVSAASFGPVLILALVGVVRWHRQWRLLAPIYLIIGYFTFVHVVTIASLRYRLPIEPLLIVLAAEPLSALIETIRRGATHRFQ